MERLTRDQMLMQHAVVAGKRGTCSRLRVGAVFSRDGRIITTGYNGTPAGLPHCNHNRCTCDIPQWGTTHSTSCNTQAPCTQAHHAERNGIDFAAKHGLSLEGSELHVTHSPCIQCAGSLLNVGVVRVRYSLAYRLRGGVDLLLEAGIAVFDTNGPVG